MYSDLGAGRQLNEIVFAGSHDAAITGGPDNAKTQGLDIQGQALAGVRFFDIRIAAHTTSAGPNKTAELAAFHAPGLDTKAKNRVLTDLGGPGRQVEISKLTGASMGAVWGMGLTQILTEARNFVTGVGQGEFIILKFDKCTNWPLIADTCRQVLGNTLYGLPLAGDPNNINESTLAQLANKVICAFMTPGYNAVPAGASRDGITEIKNLYKPPTNYTNIGLTHPTIQYWGAGGTKINNKNFDQKIQENITTQKSILNKASMGVADKKNLITRTVKTPGCGRADPNALGMMYWTTTGAFESISMRNDRMWHGTQVGGLQDIWQSGLADYFNNALPNVPVTNSVGGLRKMFMPNIVMIDFSNITRCEHIYDLNTVAAVQLMTWGVW
jgi:hypothetical protein